MATRNLQFLALVISALALIPSAAHLAALPNKLLLSPDDYIVVQGIYQGWAVLGFLWPAAAIANLLLAIPVRKQKGPCWLALLAAGCFLLMLVVFFVWTQPANTATQNWTMVPDNWEALRGEWEYSHALNAVIGFIGFCLVVLSVLIWRPETPDR